MIKILATAFISLISVACDGQSISFSKNAYKTNESIKTTVVGDLQGVENGIKNNSYVASQGILDLGAASKPGFYRVDFKFKGNVTKSYLIGILSQDDATTEEYIIPIDNPGIAIASPIVVKMFRYFQMEQGNLLDVTKNATIKFGRENAVGLVLNVSFCITMVSGQPVIAAICKKLSASNLKKLGFEVMKAYVDDMKAKDYITEAEYNSIVGVMATSQIGAILKNNCSLIFKYLKMLANNQDLKVAIGYIEQQCKTTIVIIDKVKIP
jgi:hypothetical protein